MLDIKKLWFETYAYITRDKNLSTDSYIISRKMRENCYNLRDKELEIINCEVTNTVPDKSVHESIKELRKKAGDIFFKGNKKSITNRNDLLDDALNNLNKAYHKESWVKEFPFSW